MRRGGGRWRSRYAARFHHGGTVATCWLRCAFSPQWSFSRPLDCSVGASASFRLVCWFWFWGRLGLWPGLMSERWWHGLTLLHWRTVPHLPSLSMRPSCTHPPFRFPFVPFLLFLRCSAQVATFTADEMRRYEAYRRSDLKKERVKKVLSGISPVFDKMAPSDAYVIAVKGLAKLFVGDVVETAATVAAEWGDRTAGDQGLAAPPLQTKHLRVCSWTGVGVVVYWYQPTLLCSTPFLVSLSLQAACGWCGQASGVREWLWLWASRCGQRLRVFHRQVLTAVVCGRPLVDSVCCAWRRPSRLPLIPQEAYRRLRRDGAFPIVDRRGGSFLS